VPRLIGSGCCLEQAVVEYRSPSIIFERLEREAKATMSAFLNYIDSIF
jgi:hypothetical protein